MVVQYNSIETQQLHHSICDRLTSIGSRAWDSQYNYIHSEHGEALASVYGEQVTWFSRGSYTSMLSDLLQSLPAHKAWPYPTTKLIFTM